MSRSTAAAPETPAGASRTPRPLRIVHMAATPSGAPWMIAFLREQQRRGHDVSAVIPSLDGTIAPALAALGIPCHTTELDLFTSNGPLDAVRRVWRLVRLLRRLRPDVVHSHILQTNVIARLAAWLADVPLRMSMNSGPFSLESEVLRVADVGTTFADTTTIASCVKTRELYARYGVPPEQLELIYYGSDVRRFDPALADGSRVRRELGLSEPQLLIGYVAYFYARLDHPTVTPPGLVGRSVKGHDVLLRAMPHVLAAVPEAKLVLVGRGWGAAGEQHEQEMRALASDLGLQSAVIFAGERTDVPDVLAALDVAVHCSLSENLGGTIESLQMARPMVVSNVGGMVDAVIHERTGLVVPPDDPRALAEGIVRLLRDRVLARRLGEEGRRHVLENLTLDRSIDAFEAVYGRALRRFRSNRPPRESHYRLTRTLLRAAVFPFRTARLYRDFHAALRVQKPERPTFRERVRRLWLRILPLSRGRADRAPQKAAETANGFRSRIRMTRNAAGAMAMNASRTIARFVRETLRRRGRIAESTHQLRVAQIAGAWQNCEWLVAICRGLAEKGHEVHAIIDATPGDLAARLRDAGVTTHTVAMTFAIDSRRFRLPAYLIGIPLAALRVAAILRRERVDVAQSHIFPSVLIGRLATVIARTPHHVSMIPGPRHLEAPLTRFVDRITWWLDDLVIAGCQNTRKLYRMAGAYDEKVEVVYYGADAERFDPANANAERLRKELGISPSSPVVSLVAHFYAPSRGLQAPNATRGVGLKGHETFLAAARRIAAEAGDVHFVLAGSGTTGAGEEYRASLAARCLADPLLEGRVHFTGKIGDVPSLLAASDVTVQCSLSEGLGGTIEALMMERPTVATAVGGMPESVIHEKTGLLVEPRDPTALAAAILRLLRDRESAAMLGRNGRRAMMARFTAARTVDDLDAILRRFGRPATSLRSSAEATA